MDDEPGDEDGVGHRLSSIAAATRSACTVSATSWVRMIFAPPCAAIRCAAIEPPRRCCGSDGDDRADEALARGADQERQAERAQFCRAAPAPSCSARGSCQSRCRDRARYFRVAMPALAAISSERAKKAAMSFMMSIAASALSRLCMTTTGALRSRQQLCHVGDRAAGPRRRWRWRRPGRAPRPRRRFHAVDGDGNAERDHVRQHRLQPLQFFFGRDRLRRHRAGWIPRRYR